MSKAHVFLRDSQLFVTTETLPDIPFFALHANPNIQEELSRKFKEYKAALASIRERAVLADWFRLDVYTIDKYAHGESGDPEFWVHKGDDKRARVIEGEFYPLDCEVRYEFTCKRGQSPRLKTKCGVGQFDGCNCNMVAILSPIESQSFKCRDCGCLINKGEHDTFGVCDNCYDKHYGDKEESQDDIWDEITHAHNKAIGDAELCKGKPGEQFHRGQVNAFGKVLYLKYKFTITRNPK